MTPSRIRVSSLNGQHTLETTAMKKFFGCVRGILYLPIAILGVVLYAMFILPFVLIRAVFCLVGLC